GRALLGGAPRPAEVHRHAGAVDPSSLEKLVMEGAPWSFIPRNLAAGRLEALSVSATHIASGHTVIFVQRRDGTVPDCGSARFAPAGRALPRPQPAPAGAPTPLFSPPVPIEGQYYCDGSVRQNTPLAPALRLGADRVLVVSLRHR